VTHRTKITCSVWTHSNNWSCKL